MGFINFFRGGLVILVVVEMILGVFYEYGYCCGNVVFVWSFWFVV